MNKELILESELLDILFYNRNKTYGAYELRMFYPSRIKNALLIMFGLVILLSSFTFISKADIAPDLDIETIVYSLKIPELEKKPIAEKQPGKVYAKQQTKGKSLNNILLVNQKDSSDLLKDSVTIVINNLINNVDITGSIDLNQLSEIASDEYLSQALTKPILLTQNPFENPDIQASFPGGEKALIRFLQQNLQSPKELSTDEIVAVKIKFVVDFDGDLQRFSIEKDGGEMFNNEVLRVLRKMPKWNPGKMGGQNVPVYYTIPVKFTAYD